MSYYRIFVGTLGQQGRLIEWNYKPKQGRLTQNKQICSAPGFSYIVTSPLNNFLYWAGKISDERSAIYSVRVSPTDTYETLSRVELGSSNISHLQTDYAGTYLFVSCYDKGLVCVYELLPDGRIGRCLDTKSFQGCGPIKERQETSHPHSLFLSSNSKTAAVCDLGADLVSIFRFDQKAGKLHLIYQWNAKPGMGPRHAAFSPDGNWLCVLTELSSELILFRLHQGKMEECQCLSAIPRGVLGMNLSADIKFSQDGKFVCVSNRGTNNLCIFQLDPFKKKLLYHSFMKTKGWPRGIYLSPNGNNLVALNESYEKHWAGLEIFDLSHNKKITQNIPMAGNMAVMEEEKDE